MMATTTSFQSFDFPGTSVLFINIVFVSLFCLRQECRASKSIVLFNLILSDWFAVLCGTAREQTLETNSFPRLECIFQEPSMLLHTGLLFLSIPVLVINIENSNGLLDTRESYIHLVVFNGLSLSAASMLRDGLGQLLLKLGYQDNVVVDLMGTMFVTSVHRMTFLMMDSVYFMYLRYWKRQEKNSGFTIPIDQEV